jgi:hypothetical protein
MANTNIKNFIGHDVSLNRVSESNLIEVARYYESVGTRVSGEDFGAALAELRNSRS